MQRDEAEKEETWYIAQRVFEKMSARDVHVIELLLFDEQSPDEVARRVDMKVTNIYGIRRKFQQNCRNMRTQLKNKAERSRSDLSGLSLRAPKPEKTHH